MSALSDQGLSQGKMGAAIDTWKQTLLHDADLTEFHEGEVQILQKAPREYRWRGDFACAVFPVGIESTDFDIGSRERLLGITTGFYYRDSVDEREEAEAGIEDLEELWDAAVASNESLLWDLAGGWPPVPAGGAAVADQSIANRLVARLATRYEEFLDPEGEPCGERIAEFTAVYSIRFQT